MKNTIEMTEDDIVEFDGWYGQYCCSREHLENIIRPINEDIMSGRISIQEGYERLLTELGVPDPYKEMIWRLPRGNGPIEVEDYRW